jgi:hypothetical protein
MRWSIASSFFVVFTVQEEIIVHSVVCSPYHAVLFWCIHAVHIVACVLILYSVFTFISSTRTCVRVRLDYSYNVVPFR